MTYTSHGHHISGSVLDSGDAPSKARCGGPGLCGKCSAEQAAWQKEADRLAEIKKLDDASPQHQGILIPKRFKTKPVEIEAIQFVGGPANGMDIVAWIGANGGKATWRNSAAPWTSEDGTAGHSGWPESLTIETLEGHMQAPEGWWIIRGTEGEFYPCADAPFHKKYEELNG